MGSTRIVSGITHYGGHIGKNRLDGPARGRASRARLREHVGGLRDDPPTPAEELFDGYDDVAIWCARLGVISERHRPGCARPRTRDERAAQRALRRTRELRDELLYPIFRALADGRRPARELLDRLRDQ